MVAVCLLISYLLPYISPKSLPIIAILSLFAPILLVINIVFVVYWIINLKKHYFLSLVILLVGWFFSNPIYKFTENKSSFNDDIKLMSYNVRMFNHWKWIDDQNIPKKINDFIVEKAPDVLLFQEYYNLEKQQFSYPYKYIKTKNKERNVGLAIFSEFPIVNEGSLDFKKTMNNIIFADIVIKKDTISISNMHLQSLGLKTNKENFGHKTSEKLIGRLKEGFKQQAEQTEDFLKHQKNWKGKTIIAGDFNNTSYSWVYNEISKDKRDAFIEAGKGFGKTFDYWFPMRIDFILSDETATINSFKNYNVNYSDHFPIQARINW